MEFIVHPEQSNNQYHFFCQILTKTMLFLLTIFFVMMNIAMEFYYSNNPNALNICLLKYEWCF